MVLLLLQCMLCNLVMVMYNYLSGVFTLKWLLCNMLFIVSLTIHTHTHTHYIHTYIHHAPLKVSANGYAEM